LTPEETTMRTRTHTLLALALAGGLVAGSAATANAEVTPWWIWGNYRTQAECDDAGRTNQARGAFDEWYCYRDAPTNWRLWVRNV
jgi:hypothetical protein